MKASPHIKGILFAIAGYSLWVAADGCTKVAAVAAIPPPQIVAISGFIGMSALLVKAGLKGRIGDLRPRKPGPQIIAALLSLGINLLNVVSLRHLPFLIFFIIAFTAPMIIALLAAAVLGERLTRGKIAAIIAGFAGVVIAADPFHHGGDLHGDWIGYVAALSAVSCFAVSMVLQRHIMRSEPPDSLAFMQAFAQAVICAALLPFWNAPMSWALLLLLCGGGIVNVAGSLCSMIATKHTTTATVAQFHYTQIISGAIIGFLVWHEVPTPYLVAGSLIIIAAGLYIANHMRRTAAGPAIKPP